MISDILRKLGAVGKAHAVRTKAVMKAAGISNRKIRAAVYRERKAGVLICSDTKGGYYLPASVEEVRDFIRIQERRIESHAVTLRAARAYVRKADKG